MSIISMKHSALKTDENLQRTIAATCRRIPPSWPLSHFVAVNPFLGLTDHSFPNAARLIERVGHGDILMTANDYLEKLEKNSVDERDFQAAFLQSQKFPASLGLDNHGIANLASLKAVLSSTPDQKTAQPIFTFSDHVDQIHQTNWSYFIVDEISKWCSVYYDHGQSSWGMPWTSLPLWGAWREAASFDANPELSGLHGFRDLVKSLPESPIQVINLALSMLGIPESLHIDFLHREIMTIPGWSGYVQYRVRQKTMEGGNDESLVQLLAIRLAYDLALFQSSSTSPSIRDEWRDNWGLQPNDDAIPPPQWIARYLAQQSLEYSYQRKLVGQLLSQIEVQPGSCTTPVDRKSLQAVFCIDVRSEVFRRSLEAQSEGIETIGFAGFFGMPIAYLPLGQDHGSAQCPVLLSPKFLIREGLSAEDGGDESKILADRRLKQSLADAWHSFKTASISCFAFVETMGLTYGLSLLRETITTSHLQVTKPDVGGKFKLAPRIERAFGRTNGCGCATGMSIAEQAELAVGALKNMGLTSHFGRLVLICGHGGQSANNPYGSALDCGACGGHAGGINARVAAAILNQLAVRSTLKERGIVLPEDTYFVAGLHNTTTDEVQLFEIESIPASHQDDLNRARKWLRQASQQCRRNRAPSLGLPSMEDESLWSRIWRKSRDWSDVRPEWGLAGNAAFIAARRERTKGINLEGRVFLHNYDAEQDTDRSVLELILCAPVVVASWINLQYYASTVNNRLFGSGNKVIHNVVGRFGVWQGNGGDLQTGLPLQSLHDGTEWRHEPLRLTVIIEADRTAIDGVLEKHPEVRQLFENGWIHLIAIESKSADAWHFLRLNQWEMGLERSIGAR